LTISLTTIHDLGESALIARIRDRAGAPPGWITIGIGDDAAAIAPDRNTEIVVTTDGLVEDVHFRRAWTSWHDVGHKALAVNLSDLAAMGARPRACLLTLAMPPDLAVADVDDLVDGLVRLAGPSQAPLVGGNVTRSPGPVMVDVTAIGACHRRKLLRRSGGRPGDGLYLTGTLGAAAAGLAIRQAGLQADGLTEDERQCLERLDRPHPRLRMGTIVARSRAATAAIDLSDGLATAVIQLAAASGVGAILDAASLPVAPGARRWSARTGADPVALALSGGEDYELLFAVSSRRRGSFRSAAARCAAEVPITRIGSLVKEPGVWIERDGMRAPVAAGYSHF
jgi:thiamine-monophosphate kinase